MKPVFTPEDFKKLGHIKSRTAAAEQANRKLQQMIDDGDLKVVKICEHEPDEEGPSNWDNSRMVCVHCGEKIVKHIEWKSDE